MENEFLITPAMRGYFDQCGMVKGSGLPTANAEKVRRVMHLLTALSGRPWSELTVLDVATGHGTYAIECGLQGAARVLGLDARWQRMRQALGIVTELGLGNVEFAQADARAVSLDTFGRWGAILFLGILYHLEARDACATLARISAMSPLLIIDTFVAAPKAEFEYQGQTYYGQWTREHRPTDTAAQRLARVRASIDNERSWHWAPESLWRFLATLGYNVVLEARVPLEPQKPAKRITLACLQVQARPTYIYPAIASGGGSPWAI